MAAFNLSCRSHRSNSASRVGLALAPSISGDPSPSPLTSRHDRRFASMRMLCNTRINQLLGRSMRFLFIACSHKRRNPSWSKSQASSCVDPLRTRYL
jgi:hypothetical protein